MGASESARAVFVQAVKDNLDGTPNANHPVQYVDQVWHLDFLTQTVTVRVCTLCGVVVGDEDVHRENHDKHNQIHAQIEDEAGRYKSPPTYR